MRRHHTRDIANPVTLPTPFTCGSRGVPGMNPRSTTATQNNVLLTVASPASTELSGFVYAVHPGKRYVLIARQRGMFL